MKCFASSLDVPEGPLQLPDGSLLCVEMGVDRGCVTHLSADGGARRVLARTGRPNGIALDRNGRIWIAETLQRAILRLTPDGACDELARDWNGEPFLFLNDLAFGPDGDLYFTDSGIALATILPGGQLEAGFRKLDYDGRVFRYDVRTGRVELIDRGLEFANGLAFGPGGDLFVAETMSGCIYRYASVDGRAAGRRELFANVIEAFDPAELKGPDGMKFGLDGNLYVAVFGQGDVTVVGPGGKVVRRLKIDGMCPTNLAFGLPGDRRLYVTEVTTGSIQIVDVDSDGAPLHG